MKVIKINTANVDIKTGELYENLLNFNDIFSKKKCEEILYSSYSKRLLTCKARVVYHGMNIYLVSYNTVVAMIDLHTNILYDALRVVYGYTKTSAQHISKFYNNFQAFSIYRYVGD